MENDLKDIDKIIRDKLIDYTQKSSPGFWRRLSARLNPKRGLAAMLFSIAIICGLVFFGCSCRGIDQTRSGSKNNKYFSAKYQSG